MNVDKKKFLTRFTGGFQYIAGAMMIPIIILVVCGLLMGFASPFVNFILEPGTIPYNFALMLTKIASMIMRNLPLWFTAGVSFGLAKKNKGYAALAGVFMLMALNTVIGINAEISGITPATLNVDHLVQNMGFTQNDAIVYTKLFTNVLGVFTYDMSIFGALLSSAIVGCLMNKWGDIKLPNMFTFFEGPKFIILLVPIFATIAGTAVYYIWPIINSGIGHVATFIGETGLLGTFTYGVIDRALLPFGLHHLVTMPLRYTELGGTMLIDGVKYFGTANIENALIGSSTATSYLVRNFTSGRIPINLGAWPGAALAMYLTAKKENRKKVLGILIPAVFTATIVGVTEPIEFTVLFASPILYYFVHVPLTGLAFLLTELTKVSIQGFAVVFMIPNILQPDKVQAWSLLYLIPIYFIVYFVVFRWAILKFNLKTPGRGDSVNLVSKKEYQQKAGLVEGKGSSNNKEEDFSVRIIEAFGGCNNIISVENCATRLRVKVKDSSIVASKEIWMNELEAIGVVEKAENYQIIYGPRVTNIASNVNEVLNNLAQ